MYIYIWHMHAQILGIIFNYFKQTIFLSKMSIVVTCNLVAYRKQNNIGQISVL